ncbi:MAG TPA: hypothetical protein VGZ25_00920, partial [Gemmataceae bacterium]|nr:hypothetical protein [Gemmataceae bacterium]
MSVTVENRSLAERAHEVLRRAGNPFRNYFARNPDDEVCARYHVPELFAKEREQLLGVVDLYRYDPTCHSEIVPVLGNKGAGKTHLLHSIKHGNEGSWQLLVTPGTYQKDSEFLEYLLFQVIDTLLGGGKQKGMRPIAFVGESLVRGLLHDALAALTPAQRLDLFPAPGLGRWARKLGLGGSQAQERTQWLIDQLHSLKSSAAISRSDSWNRDVRKVINEAGLETEKACELVCDHIDRTEAHNTSGLMRREIKIGFARAILLGDEAELASFLTYGFAELDFQVRPTRQDLVLSLLKVLMEVFLSLRVPVVVAFDQLEDLLLARRSDDGHRVAEAFFAGIVQVMHQIDGICFLVFAERGLWNRFVPSLDGYIQDRLNNPIHVPEHGTITALRLEAPPADLVRRVVEARLRPALEELPDFSDLGSIFPFTEEQVERIARTEPTLRDMLQQFRHLFDHVIYGSENSERPSESPDVATPNRLPGAEWAATVKSVVIVENSHAGQKMVPTLATTENAVGPSSTTSVKNSLPRAIAFQEIWDQEVRSARRKLEPEGALTGATREIQAGLGSFLQTCHEHGVKVGPWRLQHVVGEWTFGDHPTYGAITIAHWVCKDGQPWKVGVGLFLGRGPAKPKDLATKLSSLDVEPAVIDHLILLRPEDDLALSGKSKSLWQEAERRGRHARLEGVSLDNFAVLYGIPRFLAAVTETQASAQPVPNLADLIQERCEKLLEQVCMPV